MIHYGDVQKINGAKVPMVDVITFGAPCQDLSIAGKRAGMKNVAMGDDETTRSGLFFEAIRIIKEMRNESFRQLSMRGTDVDIRLVKPRYAVYENVPGAFSSNKGEDFRAVLEETARVADKDAVIPGPPKGKWTPAGAIMGDGWSIAWRVHDAQFWGVPQRRKRIALVADFGGITAPEILFERESLPRDSEQSEQSGEEAPEAVRRSTNPSSFTLKVRGGREVDSLGHKAGKGALIQTELSGTLGVSQDQTLICLEGNGSRPSHQGDGWHEGDPMYTLNSTEHHAIAIENHPADSRVKISEDGMVQTLSSRMGTGGGNVPMVMEPILLESNQNHATVQTDGVSTALPASMGMGGGYVPMVVEGINGEISGTLDASYYKGCGERQGVEREVVCVGNGQLAQAKISDKVGALNCMHDQQAIITYGLDRASYNQGQNAKYDFCIDEEKVGAQTAKGPGEVCQSVVRRLTPLECERLQGYPDGWTDIGDWVDSRGKTHNGDADSPRYKALGNSIALPFWQWMAGRMVSNLGERPTMASLFDGIGGFPLVFSRCGCEPIWASEIEEFPIAVTKKRFPEQKED